MSAHSPSRGFCRGHCPAGAAACSPAGARSRRSRIDLTLAAGEALELDRPKAAAGRPRRPRPFAGLVSSRAGERFAFAAQTSQRRARGRSPASRGRCKTVFQDPLSSTRPAMTGLAIIRRAADDQAHRLRRRAERARERARASSDRSACAEALNRYPMNFPGRAGRRADADRPRAQQPTEPGSSQTQSALAIDVSIKEPDPQTVRGAGGAGRALHLSSATISPSSSPRRPRRGVCISGG